MINPTWPETIDCGHVSLKRGVNGLNTSPVVFRHFSHEHKQDLNLAGVQLIKKVLELLAFLIRREG
jgi:hypothetical protein